MYFRGAEGAKSKRNFSLSATCLLEILNGELSLKYVRKTLYAVDGEEAVIIAFELMCVGISDLMWLEEVWGVFVFIKTPKIFALSF